MKTISTLFCLLAITTFSFAQQRTTINQAISIGEQGLACVGGFFDKDNIATPATSDFARLTVVAGVGCTQWLRGELDGPATPGDYAGFRVKTTSVVDLMSSITVATYDGATRKEAKSGSNLLQLISGGEGYVYFKTTLPHNAVRLEIGGVVTALFTTDVYLGFSQATLPETALPVKFGALQISKQTGYNTLNWKLTTDENLSNLQVERSADGRVFTTVADVAVNNSGAYQFRDAGTNVLQYYRVKAITTLGKTYTSNIASVIAGAESAVALQNPVQGAIVMQTSITKPLTILIHNSVGQPVAQTTKAGGGQYSINLPAAKSGLYLVSVYDGKQLIQQSRVLNL